jgi:hypothetical protein
MIHNFLMKTTKRVICATILLAIPGALGTVPAMASLPSLGRTYYLNPAGSDNSDGLSPNSAWLSIDRANKASFAPGDRILLRGGAVFPGTLHLDEDDAGNARSPVVIGSYGTGRATITGNAGPGVYVHNTGGVEVRDLIVTGNTAAYGTAGGIVFYNDRPAGNALPGAVISDVDVSGFNNGIEIGGTLTGFREVTVTRAVVHGNREAGLVTYGPAVGPGIPKYANQNVSVSSVEAFQNAGDATNAVRNTGSGIILGSVRGGTISKSAAHDNGWLCTAGDGPAGIWAYDSTGVVIEHNVSYHNLTGGQDGDGFDLDQNTSDSVLQYNLAYDNDGAGFLLYAAHAGLYNRNNIVRYNVSTGSPRVAGWYGAITVAGYVSGARVYGNKAVTPAVDGVYQPAVRLAGALSDVLLRDNVLVSGDTGPFVASDEVNDHSAISLRGNDYYGPAGLLGTDPTG